MNVLFYYDKKLVIYTLMYSHFNWKLSTDEILFINKVFNEYHYKKITKKLKKQLKVVIKKKKITRKI